MGTIPTPEPTIAERPAARLAGGLMLLVGLVLLVVGVAVTVASGQPWWLVLAVLGVLALRGLVVLAPGEARVVQFFGRYAGTVRTPGLHWVNPLTTRTRLSVRIRNHETVVAKVNDAEGNPIEMAVVVVWQIEDTARAVFEVDDFVRFVGIQTETAVRHIATTYPYDNHADDERLSLRENAEEITGKLSAEIAERVRSAGVKVIESRLTHLAYAPEIAGAMLQRQQAGAVVAARQRIVEGAVGMVELALARLAERDVVELDEERKATMVSNLLVVLCGDRATQPVVNAGSLY
ncbi:SPFH domain-containing protein [Kutzneria kofuensis]|uniref:Regulator of protease activity HflC (Stomatin/prohibitin superfamily) n=1 Tax=Kutzneria kofuensis TaxID=103725 RepID=A0A7W9NFJ4_9PSEU|nr:SPFH domain-containing protein [Kutzneria kofuensis]MBB5890765.1 regulator of protease activity HflC (stomatin/prohibitin superfamily) [Kutzneria kofuensis]